MMQHLQAALNRSPGEYTLEDVIHAARTGEVRLWPGHRCGAATEESRALHVWLAGGDMRELLSILAAAEAEHKARGFDLVTVSNARKGWARVLKPLGYERREMLVKEL